MYTNRTTLAKPTWPVHRTASTVTKVSKLFTCCCVSWNAQLPSNTITNGQLVVAASTVTQASWSRSQEWWKCRGSNCQEGAKVDGWKVWGASLVLFPHFVQCLQVLRGGSECPLCPLSPLNEALKWSWSFASLYLALSSDGTHLRLVASTVT